MTTRRHVTTATVCALYQRQDGACGRGRGAGCGEALVRPDAEPGSYEPVEIDHIVPIAVGGADTERNMQLLHGACHARKSADEAGDRL